MPDIEPKDNFLGQIRQPKLSDKALIALSLAAEATSIDSNLNLFSQLPEDLNGKIERSVYNKRKRRLSFKTQQLQARIADIMISNKTHHLIDSTPLEVCKFRYSTRLWLLCCSQTALL